MKIESNQVDDVGVQTDPDNISSVERLLTRYNQLKETANLYKLEWHLDTVSTEQLHILIEKLEAKL